MDIPFPAFLTALLPVFTLLLGAITMLVLRLYRPRFAYHWLAAAASALVTWPLVLWLHRMIPTSVPLLSWQPEGFFPSSPALLVDTISWSFAMALASLVVAIVLSDVVRATGTEWVSWAGCLVLAALGTLAVMAGNPLTLTLTWAALDFTELIILLLLVQDNSSRQQVAFSFAGRLLALVLLVWAMLLAGVSGNPLSFSSIPADVHLYLLLAASLRLIVLPFHLPISSQVPLRRSLGTQLRLASVAPGLMLMVRAAGSPTTISNAQPLLGLVALVALVSAIIWAAARNEIEARPYWIMGMACFALAAAVRGQPAASLAWGIALLLPGGLLFLFSARHRRLLFLPVLGLLSLSTLPFTPTWQASRLYLPPFEPMLAGFLIAQAMLLLGYLRHALKPGGSLAGIERWVWAIYPLGLALLLIGQVVIAWWSDPPIPGTETPWTGAWSGLAAAILATMLVFQLQRRPALAHRLQSRLRQAVFPTWISPTIWWVYRDIRTLVSLVSQVLEGEGGILWALLLLVLMLTYIAQRAG